MTHCTPTSKPSTQQDFVEKKIHSHPVSAGRGGAVALSQLPTRWGRLGLTLAQQLAPAAWGCGRMCGNARGGVSGGLLPHLGGAEGTAAGRHPLVSGLMAAMEDMGARERVGVAEADGHPMPEGLRTPGEAPAWESFGDTRPTSQKELAICQHGSHWLRLFDAANPTVRARLLSLSRDSAAWHLNALPEDGSVCLKPIASVISLCLQLGITFPLVREVSAVGTGRCPCGGEVDQFAYHYLACSRRGMFTCQRKAVQDVLVEMLRKVFDPASMKKAHIYHRSYSPRWRPDITLLNYDGRVRHLIIDVVFSFP
ncbi:hypothetical protein CYMTET_2982 [Cymbomonas tetramitiformis]|uniref:Uncharacterized protein n=1 Tax=Cymbomonas tetramitiformis TaxID=36881 RepID=A0AAE0H488_9CHLO|nr:hypothetical protein CYMTET_2982 [Cymbomonas tetramitiformis]